MADMQPGYWDYLKAAFKLKIRLPLLGHMPVNQLAVAGFVILGIGNPAFWLLGLGMETAYLLWLSGNERFQKLVRGGRLSEGMESWREHERLMLEKLDDVGRRRYRQLAERCEGIIQMSATDEMFIDGLSELNQVRPAFLQLLNLRERITRMLVATKREDIEADIKCLQERLKQAPAGSALARSIEETLKIQEARLANLDRSAMSLQYASTELERIEKQLSLIAEGATASRNPEYWSAGIDGIMKTIQGTTEWMASHSDLFERDEMPPPAMAGARTAQKQ